MGSGRHRRPWKDAGDVGVADDVERGAARRRLLGLLPGTRDRRRQIVAYADEWRRANDDPGQGTERLWVVLGDSTAQGVGASAASRGYVGLVRNRLEELDLVKWRVVNLSRSGALAADVLADQVPELATLAPDLVSCAVGANDLLRRPVGLAEALTKIATELPAGSMLANLPRGLRERDARQVNQLVAELASTHELRLVDLWAHTGPPWRGKYASDWFHPNDLGYQDWAAAFLAAL